MNDIKCVKLYLPARECIVGFKEFLCFCARFGINTVMLEVGGAMEYRKHREINEGWRNYSALFRHSPDAAFQAQYANNFPKNAIHWENGGGDYLLQAEVRDILAHCRSLGLNVIPEIPSLTHCDYLLYAHHELAERQEDSLADHYCPSDERVYELLFDILQEVIEVFQPSILNIGHDELYTVGICEKCKTKNAEDLYTQDILRIYTFLKKQNIRTMMWADKLLCSRDKKGVPYGGNELHMVYAPEEGGGTVTVPSVWKTIERLPKDILLLHWHYLFGEWTENLFAQYGFDYIYANLNPLTMPALESRLQKEHAVGYCISNWSGIGADLLQRNGIYFSVAFMNEWRSLRVSDPDSLLASVVAISEKLYRDRLATLGKNLIRVRHASLIAIEHRAFADGNFMDYDKDCLGWYEIVYQDGSVQREKIYFGLNVNLKDLKFDRNESESFELFDVESCLTEATYSCRYIPTADGMQYEYAFVRASESDVISWKFVPSRRYGDVVQTYEFSVE